MFQLTPAEKIAVQLWRALPPGHLDGPKTVAAIADALRDYGEQRASAMREACARFLDEHPGLCDLRVAAAAIRALPVEDSTPAQSETAP